MTGSTKPPGASGFAIGCDFLGSADLEALIEGRLDRPRAAQFEAHLEQGCSACLVLQADVTLFRHLLAEGLAGSERQEAERLKEPLRARLLAALRRQPQGGS